jgi:hypothetical protein
MHRQSKTESNRDQKPINRRNVLKMALAAGLASVPVFYGLDWLSKFRKGHADMLTGMEPREVLADETSLPRPAIDRMVPSRTHLAVFAMG